MASGTTSWLNGLGQKLAIGGVLQDPTSAGWNFVSGVVATYNAATGFWDLTVAGGGTLSHSLLLGLTTGDDHTQYQLAARVLSPYSAASNNIQLSDARKFITTTRSSAIALVVPPNSTVAFPVNTELNGANLGSGALTLTAGAGVTLNGAVAVPQSGWWWAKKTATDTWQTYVGGSGGGGGGDLYADGHVPLTADWDIGGFKIKNAASPVLSGDVATKAYVDASLPTSALLVDGSRPLTADWAVGNKQMTGLRMQSYNGVFDNGNISSSKNITVSAGQYQKATLVGNCTISFTIPAGPSDFEIEFIQDSTGGRTLAWIGVTFIDAVNPTINPAANASTFLRFKSNGTTTFGGLGKLPLANMADAPGLSVRGRAATGTGVTSDITSSAADQVVCVNGANSAVLFKQVATGGITDGAVTNIKIAPGAPGQIKGTSSGGATVDTDRIGDSTTQVEGGQVSGENFFALGLGHDATVTDLPANCGNGIGLIGEAATEPSTGSAGNNAVLIWSKAGSIRTKGPLSGSGLWAISPNSHFSRWYAPEDATGTTSSTSLTTIGTIDTSPLPDACAGIIKVLVEVQDGSNALACQEIQAGFQIIGGTLQSGGSGTLLAGSVAQGAASLAYSGNNLLIKMTSSDSVAKAYKVLASFTYAVKT